LTLMYPWELPVFDRYIALDTKFDFHTPLPGHVV
jgi:hypothetical protein